MKQKPILTALLGFSSVFLSFGSTQAHSVENSSLELKLKNCTIDVVDSSRLACFDSITQALDAPIVKLNKAPAILPESLGGGKFDKNKAKPEGSRGKVSSCQKSHDGRWFFIFEEGQIWKQSNKSRRRYNYKDCDFSVLIRKDSFGYMMFIDELSREVRVKRHK